MVEYTIHLQQPMQSITWLADRYDKGMTFIGPVF